MARGDRDDHGPAQRLVAASETLGIEIDLALAAALVALLDRVALSPQNLTSVDDTRDAVNRHLADSLAGLCVPEIRAARSLVDVGSGAGFPGIVLGMARLELRVTLLESERRKAEWLRRASADTANVTAVHARSEVFARSHREKYEIATIRALAEPPAALELAAPLIASGGVAVLWGARRDAEMEGRAARAGAQLGLVPGPVLGVDSVPAAARHLHLFRKVDATPDRFPRRPGRAISRPLA